MLADGRVFELHKMTKKEVAQNIITIIKEQL
jgi:hypothetical protein